LLMDEPTNHLDLTTREALSIALNEFEGTVMLVSHDRALLRETCDEFWLVTGGHVEPFDGDLDDYQKWLLDVSRATAKGQPPPPVPKAAPPAPPPAAAAPVSARKATPAAAASAPRDDRKQSAQARSQLANRTRPLRQEITQIDARLAALAAEKIDLEAKLARGKLPGPEIAEIGRTLNHGAAEVARLEERWLQAQSELETMQAAG
jgi:ATP-binding cassette, subfamily F, member 3